MKIVLLISILLLMGCTVTESSLKTQRKAWGFENWNKDFKDRAFCLCLLNGYQDKNIENAILKLDKSYYNGVDIAIFDPILKPVIEKEVIQMKLDSAASIKLVSEGAAGKRIFEHCLNFYKSRRLDSLTKMEKPKWSQIQNIEEEISKVIPSY